MCQRFQNISTRTLLASLVSLLIAVGPFCVMHASAARLGQRSIRLSNSAAGSLSTYNISFSGLTVGPLGSIRLQFCSNDPIVDDTCSVPAGMNISTAILASQSGETGFSINSGHTTNNEVLLSRTPVGGISTSGQYIFDNVVNPSAAGTTYLRILTYASNDGSGSYHDYGGLAFTTNEAVSVNAHVPPYLLFCAAVVINDLSCAKSSGDYINFGSLSAAKTSASQSQMLVATNAENGYSIFLHGNTMTSGNDIINQLTTTQPSKPGSSQFGLNLTHNLASGIGSDPQGPGKGISAVQYNQPDHYRFNDGETIASASAADDYRLYTVSYIVNIPKEQPPGVYVSTITYISLANY